MPGLDSPFDEAKRLVDAATDRNIQLRLIGGVAFYLRCPSTRHRALQRSYGDVDVMGHSKSSRKIKDMFTQLEYVPRETFNAMQRNRLIFNDMEHNRRIDIFLDVFEMCHKFNFKDRLGLDEYTVPLADLLATKLQIVEINQKDLKDMASLLIDYPVVEKDSRDAVNGAYLARLCSDDWGIYKTFEVNLDKLVAGAASYGLKDNQDSILEERGLRLKKLIEEAPKSLRWKIRAKVGESVRWYELPEGDRQVVDSRIVKGPD